LVGCNHAWLISATSRDFTAEVAENAERKQGHRIVVVAEDV